MSHSSVLLHQWASVNKGWHWVKVPFCVGDIISPTITLETTKLRLQGCWLLDCLFVFCFCFERQGSPAPISFLFSCVLPTGGPLVKPATPTLELVLTLIRLDWFPGIDAGWPERSADWPSYRPPGPEGGGVDGGMDGWMHLPPNSYQPEQLLVGGLVWITTQPPPNHHTHSQTHSHTHTITSPCSLTLFCRRDNTHSEWERGIYAQGIPTTNKDR